MFIKQVKWADMFAAEKNNNSLFTGRNFHQIQTLFPSVSEKRGGGYGDEMTLLYLSSFDSIN